MNLDKWNDFLSKWARAVSAYGTPIDFVAGAKAKSDEVKFGEETYNVRILSSPNNALRRELTAKQKKYIPKQSAEKYGVKLDLENCFLCQNVVQALDATLNPQECPDNVIQNRGDYLIMPNRYPALMGHSLFVPANHDDSSGRVMPQTITENEKKRVVYPAEEGKTAGEIMTIDYLDALVEACDANNLVGLNNHVRDAMSIPGHKHFHLFPEDFDLFDCMPRLRFNGVDDLRAFLFSDKNFRDTDYGERIKRVIDTPFNTLAVFLDIKRDKGIETASNILSKMERANAVFTLAYNRSTLLISPRKNIPAGERIQLGAGVPVHFFADEHGVMDVVKKYVPLNNENYDWGRFI
ncbi:MAG: hypothetical protein ABH840_04440 [Nanoarchaeota archaeon]